METFDSKISDRLAALEARVLELERRTRTPRESIGKLREVIREKLRPKVTHFHHYPPRELRVSSEYLQTRPPDVAPSLAIVTPSFNHDRFIKATIDSVLDQNYPALRYHVQDGSSTDRTRGILADFGNRVSWESRSDRGQAHAINIGFERVEGEIMAYLNSDDLLLPGALAYVAHAFEDSRVDIVYGHRICLDEDGKEIGRWVLPPHDGQSIKWADFIPQETMFWRRRVWEALGGFDESFECAMDWDFILRAHSKGMRFKRLPRFLGCFRVHEAQKTFTWGERSLIEMDRLRRIHLGFVPDDNQVATAIAGFLRRHVLFHRLYKLHVLRY